MESDSNEQIFSTGEDNYEDLLAIFEDIDICEVDIEKTFVILRNLASTNKMWIHRNNMLEAKKRVGQSFLIAIGLLILCKSNNINLSEIEQENVSIYFETLKDVYNNSIAIEMIRAWFFDNTEFDFENLKKELWLSNESELEIFKDLYDAFYVNHFRIKSNDLLLKCSNIIFQILLYRATSSEIFHNLHILKLSYTLIKNEIVLETELQTLFICLEKLKNDTVIKSIDSEQEALNKLNCRIISCKIAKELYVREIRSDIIDEWKKISENKEEFIEIRKIVFDISEND